MAHGINPNQLHAWRRQLLRGELQASPASDVQLMPVELPLPSQSNTVDVAPVATRVPEPARQREGVHRELAGRGACAGAWIGQHRIAALRH